jgi:EAL domain-containing protein (putative c-di-GMP-specific phosphodiesterase class I)
MRVQVKQRLSSLWRANRAQLDGQQQPPEKRSASPRSLLGDAELGLERGEFFFVAQPILRLHEKRLSGFEYLMRWRHPDDGILAPARFISLVEDSILAHRFTELLIERAADTLQRWQRSGHGDLTLAINLGASEMASAELPQRIQSIFAAHDVLPGRLEIELTGAVHPDSLDGLAEAIRAVQAIGTRVALDDLGGGYNSLTLLQQLPADIVKFDRSYLANVPSDSEATRMIEMLVKFAHAHGKQIVLSGVETQEQFAWAKSLHDVNVQGFYIDKPHDETRINELIDRYGQPSGCF